MSEEMLENQEDQEEEKKIYTKNIRILDLYTRFTKGQLVNKVEFAGEYEVDERSVQRDIDDVRVFLAEQSVGDNTDSRIILYDRKKKGFYMEGSVGSTLSNSEILAVSKILMESRAFTKKEMNNILEKLIEGCVPYRNMELVSHLISNEKFHYVELHHKSHIQDKLWELGQSVENQHLLEIVYEKQVASKETVKRMVEPAAIIFSEYYFYLNAYIVEKDEKGDYVRKYDFPAVFRVDRIKKYKETDEKFKVAYTSRFKEGEFRKRIQFMYPGKLETIQIRYTGRNIEAILDRLPTAKIVSQRDDEIVIEAEVYGKGVLMWLLSQGSTVEVLRPKSMREEMKKIIQEMLELY